MKKQLEIENEIDDLQKQESKLWAELVSVCEEHTLQTISTLIEINIELEKLSNQ